MMITPKTPTETKILEIIERYGGIDGSHHKMWLIDQIARIILGDEYPQWVIDICDGPHGLDTYGWDEGIPP